MRRKHLFVKGYTVTFDFMGKSGKHHHKSVTDRRLAYVIKQLDEQPGYEVFSYYDENKEKRAISSDKVNDYIKKHMGEEFSAKDFRTWGGTLIAIETLAAEKLAINEKDRKKAIYVCVKLVSQRLGNTPAVARNSYIDPEVFNSYMKGADFAKVKETISQMRPRKYLTSEERCALEVLNAVT
jgi:DNA topoisomerase-1